MLIACAKYSTRVLKNGWPVPAAVPSAMRRNATNVGSPSGDISPSMNAESVGPCPMITQCLQAPARRSQLLECDYAEWPVRLCVERGLVHPRRVFDQVTLSPSPRLGNA